MPSPHSASENQSVTSKAQVVSVEASASLPFTWERLIPKQIPSDSASQRILEIHLLHYEIAQRYVSGKRVLDIASGTGYGSQMLGLAGASSVVGVDICAETVQYAKQHYQQNNVEFVCASAEQFEWHEPFDVVVSFETIEHVPHPSQFLERLRSLIVPGGDLLLSVPLGETRHIDPYHLHAFSQEDIFTLLEQAGFSVEQYRCDDWGLSRFDLLRWRQLYPEARPSIREMLFTRKGWMIARDFYFRGGVPISQLMVAARASGGSVVEERQALKRLER